MNKDIELYELIENYLRDNLSPEEKYAFEIRISSDPELELTVEKHQQLAGFIEEGTFLEIRDSIQRIHNEFPGGGGLGISGKRILFFSALTIISALLVYIFLNNNSRKDKSLSQAVSIPRVDTIEKIKLPSDNTENKVIAKEESLISKLPVEDYKQTPNAPTKDEISQITDDHKEATKAELDKNKDSDKSDSAAINIVPGNTGNEPPTKEQDELLQKDSINCDTVTFSAEVLTIESCEERATGKITLIINSTRGTTPPYFLSIDKGKNYQQKSQIVDLLPGIYPVWLKDQNNCLSKIGDFLVGSVICDHEYIFAPDKGERWAIPTKDKKGIIKIYTKQGSLVYMENIEEGQNLDWDGTSLDGNPQPMGVYRFILEFGEGGPVVGNVTIVR